MTTFVRRQLVIFTVLAIAAFATIALVYLRLPTVLGVGQIEVTARTATSGGIYPNANVTFRGYTVGKVKEVNLTRDGVDVVMSIDEALSPPGDSRAEVHSVSAIGEQFVDFVPSAHPSAQRINDGAFIPEKRTSTPTPTAGVLDDVDGLLATVDHGHLNTVLDEFDAGFRGIGPELAAIADNTKSLVDSAQAAYPQTEKLINDAEPFLNTQVASADDARSWARQLSSVTEQLKESDGDVRAALRDGETASVQAGNLVDSLRGPTPRLLENTNVLTELAQAYHKPIEQILVVYPALQAHYQAALGPNTRDMVNFNIKLNPNRPACYEGWVGPGEPGGPRDAFELDDAPYPDDQYCKLAEDDDRLVRGARNLPCFEREAPVDRRAATVQQCRGDGFESNVEPGTQLEVGGPLNDAPVFEKGSGPVEILMPEARQGRGGASPQGLSGLLLDDD